MNTLQPAAGTLLDWSQKLKAGRLPPLPLDIPKHIIYQRLTAMGLPTRPYLIIPLNEPARLRDGLQGLPGDRFYLLIEDESGQSLYSKPMLSRTNLASELANAARSFHSATAMIIQEVPFVYEGNITINENGAISGEFARWNGRPVSRGRNPSLFLTRPSFHSRVQISGSSTKETELGKRILSSLARLDDSAYRFRPGYFEIIVTQQDGGQILFHDCRENAPFLPD